MLQRFDPTVGGRIPPGGRDRADWRGVLGPGRLQGLRAWAWGVALILLCGLVTVPFGLAGKLLHIVPGSLPAMALLVLTVVAVLLVYGFAVGLGERRAVTELSVRRLLPDAGAGLLVGGAAFALAMAVLLVGGWYGISAHPPGAPWKGLAISFGSGVFEELLFRGILMRLLWEAWGLRIAVALSAAIFGAAHLGNPGHDVLGPLFIVFEAGLLLGGLYALTGRLWASIGAHAGWNFTQGYIFGAEVSGNDPGGHWLSAVATPGAPALLTGGAFGPERSLACLAVGTAAGMLVLLLSYRCRQAAGWAAH